MPSAPVLETARLTLRPTVEPDRVAWVAVERGTERVVGGCELRENGGERDGGDLLDLSWRLEPDRHGQGFAVEMVRACVAHATEHLPDRPIRTVVGRDDAQSQRTAGLAGLDLVGERGVGGDLVFEGPRVEVVSEFAVAARDEVLDLWLRVTEAGGAVGFVPGAARRDVDAALRDHEAAMAGGPSEAVLLRSPADGRLLGATFVIAGANPLVAHNRWLYRVMTDPEARGRGLGLLLLAGVHRAARESGAEIINLGVRGGTGVEAFYRQAGYVEVGRIPAAIRVAPGDDRDDITMSRRL